MPCCENFYPNILKYYFTMQVETINNKNFDKVLIPQAQYTNMYRDNQEYRVQQVNHMAKYYHYMSKKEQS